MSKKEKHRELAELILVEIGGKDNISYLVHCITRLRFNFKDKSKINIEEIKKIKGVVGTQWQGEQFQIIIGQEVGDVYKEVCELAGIQIEDQVDEPSTKKTKLSLSTLFDSISGCIAPLLPVLIGGGLIRVALMLAVQANLLHTTDQTFIVLSYIADAVFYFLPVFVGATGARKFGANMGYGMLIGGVLVFPEFVKAVNSGQALSVFGVPVFLANYSSSIFPMIMATYVLSHVERIITKYSPKMIRSITVPFLTMLIMVPLTLTLIAPLGGIIGGYLSGGIIWFYNATGFLSVGILAGLMCFFVITGTHTALLPACIELFTKLGFEPIIMLSNVLYTLNQGVVALAVALRSKDDEVRSTAFAATISSFIAGVSEPVLFGFSLKNRKLLYSSMIGCFSGGIYAGLTSVKMFSMPGSVGFLVFPAFMGQSIWNVINLFIAIGISFVITFVLSYFIALKDDNVEA